MTTDSFTPEPPVEEPEPHQGNSGRTKRLDRRRRERDQEAQEPQQRRRSWLWILPAILIVACGLFFLPQALRSRSNQPQAAPTEQILLTPDVPTPIPPTATLVPSPTATASPVPTPTRIVLVDIPKDNLYYLQVHRAVNEGYLEPVGLNVFCDNPDCTFDRWEVAKPLLKLEHGPDYLPPEAKGDVFEDVTKDTPDAAWIEDLFHHGFAVGYNPNPPRIYGPDDPVIKYHMAVFLTRYAYTEFFEGCKPRPALGGLYADVTKDPPTNAHWGHKWAEFCTYLGICPYPWSDPKPMFRGDEGVRKDVFAYMLMSALDLYNLYLSGGYVPDPNLIVCPTPTPAP